MDVSDLSRKRAIVSEFKIDKNEKVSIIIWTENEKWIDCFIKDSNIEMNKVFYKNTKINEDVATNFDPHQKSK